MSPLNDSTTAKGTLAENGIFFSDELEDVEIDPDDLKPDRDGSVDSKDGSWIGKRGSNKPPTQGVKGAASGTNPKTK